ncbi:Coenzyme PQQ synthesis protein D (PqqD) [Thermodesulfobium acidiphilum]|uniref:Coenzyme PQQ synthesis protein D (PqqD) n=1 Tax=Thermodesulfobium acidiphilum TaxID=1794699 RepID=A0A2R4W058_THEAF|nr:PqqD family protein [Thermodesulfobium acidiphilum]AWB10189.1 Coenzyme PQQ synthesis protein D (PqqD) [Thermodesulfobium acidiphilum]
MFGFNKNKGNLLTMYPVKSVNVSDEMIDGQLRLTVYHAGFFRRIFEKWFPNYGKSFINLDKYGQFVWQHCDGNFTIKDILIDMQKQFDDNSEFALERLIVFIRILASNKLIKLIRSK